jgi:hypothetical protein
MTETAVERAEAETKLPPQVRKALLALIVGGIAAILDSTMVTLALHTLVVRLHSTDGTIQWVTTGYLSGRVLVGNRHHGHSAHPGHRAPSQVAVMVRRVAEPG